MYMYVKTNTVFKQMHVYINTTQILNIFLDRVFYLWTDLPGARFDCAEKIDCLPDYPYTPPFFRGGGGVFGEGTLWRLSFRRPPLTLYNITKQLIFVSETVLWFYSTFFAYFERCLPIYKQICCHTPFTPRLNGDLQNCLINVYQVLNSMNTE